MDTHYRLMVMVIMFLAAFTDMSVSTLNPDHQDISEKNFASVVGGALERTGFNSCTYHLGGECVPSSECTGLSIPCTTLCNANKVCCLSDESPTSDLSCSSVYDGICTKQNECPKPKHHFITCDELCDKPSYGCCITSRSLYTCKDRCGQYDEYYPCHCDDECQMRLDCCDDFESHCPGYTCKDRCGDDDPEAHCQCDIGCFENGDCCNVFRGLCPEFSCVGRCGVYDAMYPCQCHNGCADDNNCCPNFFAQCREYSCFERCGDNADPGLPCQCNPSCGNTEECCGDFSDLCPVPPCIEVRQTPSLVLSSPALRECQLDYDGVSYYWSTPGYGAALYDDYFTCGLIITGTASIQVETIDFNIENQDSCLFDALTVSMDGVSTKYCGTPSISFTQNPASLEMLFTTDFSVIYPGFLIKITPTCPTSNDNDNDDDNDDDVDRLTI